MTPDKPHAKGNEPIRSDDTEERQGGPGRNPLGTHPVGTAVGGAAGAVAAGAAVGSVAGPVGAAVGAAIGAAAGGMAGKLVADLVDPQMEEEFWRKNWSDRHYIDGGFTYDQDWAPAYRYGVTGFKRQPGRSFQEAEPELAGGWSEARGSSRLDWERARPAAQDAWQRANDIAARGRPAEPDMGATREGTAGEVHEAMREHGLRDSELPGDDDGSRRR